MSVAPAPPAPPDPSSFVNAITLRAIVPESGATVRVRACGSGGPYYTLFCSNEVTGAFDVEVNRDLPDAWVSYSFMDGERLCATAGRRLPLVAGVRTPANIILLQFSGDPGLLCPLPVTTTRIIARIIVIPESGVVQSWHTEVFPHRYTFVLAD